jgi:hypothetical protein
MRVLPVVALNASTFVAVPVPMNEGIKTFILQCASAIDVNLANDSAGTDVFTLKSGSYLAVSTAPSKPGAASFTLCYAKAASSTPNLQIIQVD